MKQLNNQTITEVVSHIEQLSLTKKSGTLFLITEKNTIAQLIFLKGTIIHVRCLRQRGMDAIATVFRAGHFWQLSFKEKRAAAIRTQIDAQLSHNQILAYVRKAAGLGPVGTTPPKASVQATPPIDVDRAAAIIAPELAIYLGPMAAIVCDGYLEDVRTLAEVVRAVDEIANEIDDPTEAALFSNTVKGKLQNL